MEILNQHIQMEKQYYEQVMSQKLFEKDKEQKVSEEQIDVEAKLNLDKSDDENDRFMQIDEEEFDLNNEIDQICSQNLDDNDF